MHPAARLAAALKPQLERDRKRFLNQKGWRYVTRERLDELCQRHQRIVRELMWFGRRTRILQCSPCRIRAVVRKSRRLPAEATRP